MLAAAFMSIDTQMFLARLQQMFGVALPGGHELLRCWGKYLATDLSLPNHRRAKWD